LIELTKLNGEPILINAMQIEYVESIPESKVIMMNGKFHIVLETPEEIKRRVIEFIRTSYAMSEEEA